MTNIRANEYIEAKEKRLSKQHRVLLPIVYNAVLKYSKKLENT